MITKEKNLVRKKMVKKQEKGGIIVGVSFSSKEVRQAPKHAWKVKVSFIVL